MDFKQSRGGFEETPLRAIVVEVSCTARDLWIKGHHEANGGNISIRLSPEEVTGLAAAESASEWIPLAGSPLPGLAGSYFLATSAGSCFRTLRRRPEETLGVIEFDESGQRYRVIWGFEGGNRPTSELPVHVQVHAMRREKTGVVIHSHPTHLVALSCLMEPDSIALTRLLWQMHGECVAFFPRGIEFLPFRMSGSDEAGRVAAQALEKRSMLLWEFHGTFTAGPSLDAVAGLIETADKAAEIYLKVAAAGGPKRRLSLEHVKAIAKAVGVEPDPEILGG